MKSASETLDLLDFLIHAFVSGGSSAGLPETTEAVLRQLDFVREAILTDVSVTSWKGLPVYSSFLFHSGCGSGSFCAKQRHLNSDRPLSDAQLLRMLREFWLQYYEFERRPKRS